MRQPLRFLLTACLAILPLGAQAPRKVAVAAAGDLRTVFPELAQAFGERHPDMVLVPSFGSVVAFHAQIKNHAPFDLYLSSDAAYTEQLSEEGYGLDGPFRFAHSRLVLWVREGIPAPDKVGVRGLAAPEVRHIAIPNPAVGIHGRSAETVLRSAGLWETLKPKLVLGQNIIQTTQYLQTGAADAGFITLSCLHGDLRTKGRAWEVPQSSYPVLVHGGLILRWTKDPEAARAFRAFLLSPVGLDILKRNGFLPLEAPSAKDGR